MSSNIGVNIIYLTNLNYRESMFIELGKRSSFNLFAGNRSPYNNINTTVNVKGYTVYKIRNRFLFKGGKKLTFQFPSNEAIRCIRKSKESHIIFLGVDPHIITSLFYSLFLILFGYKISWWGHGTLGKGLVRFVRVVFFNLSYRVLVYGNDSEVSEHPKLKSKVRVVGNCMNWVDYQNTKKEESKHNMNNTLKIIFSGRIVSSKRLEILLYACSKLEIPYELKIIGDGDKKEDYKNLSEQNQMNVKFLGKKYGEDVKEIMNWADVMVISGKVGLSLVHAYGNNLPVIIHDSFDLHSPEYEIHTRNSDFLFRKDDSFDLTQKLTNIYIKRLFESERLQCENRLIKFGYYPDIVAKKILNSLIE